MGLLIISYIFGTETYSVKVAHIIDAKGTIKDEIRNDFHLIGASNDQEVFIFMIFIIDMLPLDKLFMVIPILITIIFDDHLVRIRGFVRINVGPNLFVTINR